MPTIITLLTFDCYSKCCVYTVFKIFTFRSIVSHNVRDVEYRINVETTLSVIINTNFEKTCFLETLFSKTIQDRSDIKVNLAV